MVPGGSSQHLNAVVETVEGHGVQHTVYLILKTGPIFMKTLKLPFSARN